MATRSDGSAGEPVADSRREALNPPTPANAPEGQRLPGVSRAKRSKRAADNKSSSPELLANDRTYRKLTRFGQSWATPAEIALIMGVSEPALVAFLDENADARMAYDRGQALAAISLRTRQLKLAGTNARLAIWLGKQYLGQTDTGSPPEQSELPALGKTFEEISKNWTREWDL